MALRAGAEGHATIANWARSVLVRELGSGVTPTVTGPAAPVQATSEETHDEPSTTAVPAEVGTRVETTLVEGSSSEISAEELSAMFDL